AGLTDEALRAHVREKLPEYMMPAHFVRMDRFPLTPNAKVDRLRLPRPEEASPPVQVKPVSSGVAISGDAEQQIADAFKRVLGLETIGVNDNFFNLGGHSLLAVQVHRDLKANLSPELTITDLYR